MKNLTETMNNLTETIKRLSEIALNIILIYLTYNGIILIMNITEALNRLM